MTMTHVCTYSIIETITQKQYDCFQKEVHTWSQEKMLQIGLAYQSVQYREP